MLGEKLKNLKQKASSSCFAVKSVVFPFLKLAGTDTKLGPEMRSTGETMGIGKSFELAYYKALLAAGVSLDSKPKQSALLSLNDQDKLHLSELSKLLEDLDFSIYGTQGTAAKINGAKTVPKIGQEGPDVLDIIRSGKMDIVINTPRKGGSSHTDGFKIRRAAIEKGIPCITNLSTAFELLKALKELRKHELEIKTVEEWTS